MSETVEIPEPPPYSILVLEGADKMSRDQLAGAAESLRDAIKTGDFPLVLAVPGPAYWLHSRQAADAIAACEWFAALDEPDSEARKSVTMNQIVMRAKNALGIKDD